MSLILKELELSISKYSLSNVDLNFNSEKLIPIERSLSYEERKNDFEIYTIQNDHILEEGIRIENELEVLLQKYNQIQKGKELPEILYQLSELIKNEKDSNDWRLYPSRL